MVRTTDRPGKPKVNNPHEQPHTKAATISPPFSSVAPASHATLAACLALRLGGSYVLSALRHHSRCSMATLPANAKGMSLPAGGCSLF